MKYRVTKERLKIIYCGTPDFSVPTLEALFAHEDIELSLVISMPDRPVGRGLELKSPAVIDYCKKNSIPFLQTDNINNEELPKKIDAIIVLAFAQFLSVKTLKWPRLGCFNIHTSLLPKYRGAAPIQYALLNGDKSTGVSIQKMVKKMDAGDICHFKEIPISTQETGGELYDRLKEQAALEIGPFIKKLINNELHFIPQDEKKVNFAPPLKKTDGLIDFKNSTYESIYNQIRAFKPWPGTYCFLNHKRLKIFAITPSQHALAPGAVSTQFDTLNIGCLGGAIRATTVQLEGKKATTDTALLNGLKNHKQGQRDMTITINPEQAL